MRPSQTYPHTQQPLVPPLAGLHRLFARACRVAVFSGLLAVSSGFAQTQATTPSSRSFDLPAGRAEDTLKEFAQASDSSMAANSATFAGVETNAVHGAYTPEEALSLMLAGTPLTATWDTQNGAFSVRREGTAAEVVVGGAGVAKSANTTGDVQTLANYVVTESATKPYIDGNMDIPRTSNDVQPYTIINQEAIQESSAYDLNDFLKDQITQNTVAQSYSQTAPTAGTLGFGNGLNNASQVNLRGLGNLQTLILVNGQRTASFGVNQILYQSSINGIPLSAIDHIEVLPSSASAIYGAAAAGGVVNVILKNNYTGGEIDASYQNVSDLHGPQEKLSANLGFSLGKKLHVSLIASYDDGKALFVRDEPYMVNYHYKAIQNDPTLFYSNTLPFVSGSTPNIVLDPAVLNGYTNPQNTTLTLTNGTSLKSLVTYIPPGTSLSTPTSVLDAGLLANAGSQNLVMGNSVQQSLGSPIHSISRDQSFDADLHYDLSPQIELFAELSNRFSAGENLYVLQGVTNTYVAVPGNVPNNPFQENVFVSFPLPASESEILYNNTGLRTGTAGILAHLPADWELASVYTISQSRQFDYYLANQYNTADTAAGGGGQPIVFAGALNPFVDTINNPPNLRQEDDFDIETSPLDVLSDANLHASGPVFQLPGGHVRLTLGLEARVESVDQQILTLIPPPALPVSGHINEYPGARQTTQAAYAETEIPVVSPANNVSFVNSLELQGAIRTEKFETVSDTGSVDNFPYLTPPVYTSTILPATTHGKFASTDPTVGFKYKPLDSLTFRVSYAKAFVPPTAAQLTANPDPATAATSAFFDPVTGTTYTTERNSGTNGNPNLKPQTTDGWDAGVIWEPKGALLQGLRANLEFFRTVENNVIAAPPTVQTLVDTPAEAGNITRSSPTGPITFIDFQYFNVTKEYADGWDLSLDYRKKTPVGTFNLHGGATLTEHLKEAPAVGDPLVEYVGYVDSGGVDKLKANASLSWYIGRHWTVGWSTLYYDGYKENGAPSDPEYLGAATYTPITTNTLPQGGNTIPSQVYHNVFASYTFGASPTSHHVMDGVTIQVGINDVCNSAPPFDAYSVYAPYYYSPFGDPDLRTYVLKIRKTF